MVLAPRSLDVCRPRGNGGNGKGSASVTPRLLPATTTPATAASLRPVARRRPSQLISLRRPRSLFSCRRCRVRQAARRRDRGRVASMFRRRRGKSLPFFSLYPRIYFILIPLLAYFMCMSVCSCFYENGKETCRRTLSCFPPLCSSLSFCSAVFCACFSPSRKHGPPKANNLPTLFSLVPYSTARSHQQQPTPPPLPTHIDNDNDNHALPFP